MDNSTARDSVTPSAGQAHARVKLAKKWAYLLSKTTYVQCEHAELERQLLGLVDKLFVALTSQPLVKRLAVEVGGRLVELRYTDKTSLQCTVDVLGKSLLVQPELRHIDKLPERVVTVIGALASGYAEAIRVSILEQQENLNFALRNVERNLWASEAQFNQVVTCLPSGIAVTDLLGRFLQVNNALTEILGYSADELTQLTLFDVIHPNDARSIQCTHRDLLEAGGTRLAVRTQLIRKDEEVITADVISLLVRDADVTPNHFVTVIEDTTELDLLRNEFHRQTLHDVLTSLPNRQFLITRLERTLNTVDLEQGLTLYHLDLDGFSLINHGLGWNVSERLLITVANKLSNLVAEENAMVARLGADDFMILIENSPNTPDALAMVEKINESLSELTYIEGNSVAVSACIGVVDRPPLHLSVGELLGAAEMTLRRAKRQGRRQWELFDPSQDTNDRETFRLAAAMAGSWDKGELSALYQPLVLLCNRKIVGLETFLQWDHAELGLFSHERCVDLASEARLILPLGKRLIRVACEQIQWWRQRFDHDLLLTVGLTKHQAVDSDLVGDVLRILRETGLRPEQLQIGLSVSALSAGSGDAVDNLRVLAEAGVRIALHDFGMAPGDVLCLEDVPVRAVRLMRRLVDRHWQQGETASRIGHALTNLIADVHQADAIVIVDGISSAAQALWWQQAGADIAQGSFFVSAGRAGDLTQLLTRM